ncbi:GNAT family N-acetyltransferase [Aetokthonos hydrillicola Thurmond2011]|jgi:RimJ/RimL family protein N-acetyltransferase|uniref:GNAT family N-acetyltransferase n=1 Tax=Aetokthonos hydrillicola Thurmond2011 TaxID=2712845 RepID=A0AAP5IEB6_9CYAN|nr:GNAT family N-acetyltransferase [Aetokthonos hydrillicola]MBO3459678.1 GNAT family N-acetyltransferase [Aetokthonos hydrillicola CCALA 1050]MBW4589042.1 GNAT family N-acetyltransferase [Aetokthonos hydrillicola CCALA 1050]MDR9900115.1 GNAT family N-acetyltransferase [Aetokthonos hydrillicola Thurmond2011]
MSTIFQTQRLIIREWIPKADAAQVLEMYSDGDVIRFIQGMREESLEAQQARLQKILDRYAELNKGTGAWAMVEKETLEIVGTLLLKQLPDNEGNPTQDVEVGWHLRKASWGKGYATEGGIAAINYGFKVLKLPIIYAVVDTENHASIRVTQRLGMKPMGRTRKYYNCELELFQLVNS